MRHLDCCATFDPSALRDPLGRAADCAGAGADDASEYGSTDQIPVGTLPRERILWERGEVIALRRRGR